MVPVLAARLTQRDLLSRCLDAIALADLAFRSDGTLFSVHAVDNDRLVGTVDVGSGAVTLLGPTGPTWPAFVAGSLAAAVALTIAWSRAPDLAGIARRDRGYVIATAVWAFAIVIITAGLVGLGIFGALALGGQWTRGVEGWAGLPLAYPAVVAAPVAALVLRLARRPRRG